MLTRLIPAVLVLVFAIYAPTSAHALSIQIDDSSDTLMVTSDSTTTQIVTGTGTTITDIFGNQFDLPINNTLLVIEWAAITDPTLVLQTNSKSILTVESGLTISDWIDVFADAQTHTMLFISDVEGQPPFDIAGACTAFPASFACLSETGTFVQVASTLYAGVANLSIQFRSDLDATVPEPATVALVACGLLGVTGARWWRQSCRRRVGARRGDAWPRQVVLASLALDGPGALLRPPRL